MSGQAAAMRWGARQRLQRERRRAERQRRAIAERPFEGRRGIHGPYRFRSLAGAQGWLDANRPGGEATIVDALTGHRWRRDPDGIWQRDGAPPGPAVPGPDPGIDPENAPYWMRPL